MLQTARLRHMVGVEAERATAVLVTTAEVVADEKGAAVALNGGSASSAPVTKNDDNNESGVQQSIGRHYFNCASWSPASGLGKIRRLRHFLNHRSRQ